MKGRRDERAARRRCAVLKSGHVERAAEPVVVTAPAAGAGGVTVGLVKQGERAALIEVRCKCGERISIECEYGPATPPDGRRV
jgi:hypothetical protein